MAESVSQSAAAVLYRQQHYKCQSFMSIIYKSPAVIICGGAADAFTAARGLATDSSQQLSVSQRITNEDVDKKNTWNGSLKRASVSFQMGFKERVSGH